MTNDQEQRRVVLIFGEPNQGKSTLADQLESKYGYYKIKLDDEYVDFIETRYPKLNMPNLDKVIKGHYDIILVSLDFEGITTNGAAHGARAAWQERVASLTEVKSKENNLVVVEGYLLLPALNAVREKLAGKAIVTTIEARNRQYFIPKTVNIEQIHGE